MKKLLMLVLLSGCTLAQLDLPEGSHAVTGANPRVWNRPIAFGPWKTATVREGLSHTWLTNVAGINVAQESQAYRFLLQGGDGGTRVQCHTNDFQIGRSGFWVDATFGTEPVLLCGLERHDAREVLALARTGRTEPALTGELRDADDENADALLIRSLHRAQGARFAAVETYGYEILRAGRRVAVVETANRGRVWIDPQLEGVTREKIAGAAAALLLFTQPDATGD